MLKIPLVALVSLAVGALLGTDDQFLPVRPGLLGLALFVVAALAVRQRWLGNPHTAPGSPERSLWLALAANCCVGGYLVVMLWRIGPAFVMHTELTHRFGIDTWTLVIGSMIASHIARDPEPREDERDNAIAARGQKAAYYGLVVVLLVHILALGFVEGGWVGAWSRPGIAHGLILAILTSVVVGTISRLIDYSRDAAAADIVP